MKKLFCVLSIFLLSSCSNVQFPLLIDGSSSQNKEILKGSCGVYPYDTSEAPCNIFGWQSFIFYSLSHTKEEHDAALLSLRKAPYDRFKRLILLSDQYEPLDVRIRSTDAIFNVSRQYLNRFGELFFIIATYQKNDLLNQQNAIELKAKLKKISENNTKLKEETLNKQSAIELKAELKKISEKNTKLEEELTATEAKIQAIMEIEENLNTN